MNNKERYGINIVNMSIGTSDKTVTPALTKAVNSLWDSGIVVVTASGNKEEMGIVAPGISQRILTVGNFEDRIYYKIKKGDTFYYKPDIFAPGENIVSCKAQNSLTQMRDLSSGSSYRNNYVEMSGTSMATPIVAGAAALLLQLNPAFTPDEIKSLICSSATHHDPIGMLDLKRMIE